MAARPIHFMVIGKERERQEEGGVPISFKDTSNDLTSTRPHLLKVPEPFKSATEWHMRLWRMFKIPTIAICKLL
jgi:hypothetical protein